MQSSKVISMNTTILLNEKGIWIIYGVRQLERVYHKTAVVKQNLQEIQREENTNNTSL